MPNNNNYLDNSGVEYLWSKIKDYQKNNRYIYAVKGTQTSATNVWTGAIEINALYDGLTIAYYLPYAGNTSSATLNLTLSNGTKTGAINVYLTGTTRITNQYGAGSTILLTYWSTGSISVSGTATTQNRWLRADYDANTITTATTTGNGNAVTSISASNGALTITKGSTFLTAHPTITTTTDTTSTASPSHGGTFTTIDSITRDTNGHVTKVNTKTITLPSDSNTDTKVNVTLGTTTKAYILGTSTTPTSTANGVTSISDTGVYLDTTAGRLRATTYGITNGNYVNILSSSTLSANATQTFPSTGGTLLNTGTTSYTQTVTSSDTNAYEIGKIKINGTETTIYGKYTDTNTDIKVTQSNATGSMKRPLLLSHDSTSVTDDVTNIVYRNSDIYADPSTGTIISKLYTALDGTITIRKETSIDDDLYTMLKFMTYQTDNKTVTGEAYIRVYDDHDTLSYGANMLIQSGGNVLIGGGESTISIYSSLIKTSYPTTEHLWLTSDNGIKIVLTDSSDVHDVSKYKTFELNNSGDFYQTTSELHDNNGFGVIGIKSRRFYEGNFHHIDVTTGVHYHKSYSDGSEDTFPLIYFNTSNIWVGSTGTTGAQHRGTLNLSAGFDTTNNVPYESATVAVANSDNTAATPYHILHKGNTGYILTSSDDAWSSVGVPLTSGYIFKVLRVGKGSSAPTPPEWAGTKYDNGLVVGLEDGKMLITAGQSTPRVTFAGGHNSSTVTKPEWYFKLTGTSGTTYNLSSFLTQHPTVTTGTNEFSVEALKNGDTYNFINGITRDANNHVTSYQYITGTINVQYSLSGESDSNHRYVITLSDESNYFTDTTATIPTASTSTYGITKLTSAVNSSSTTLAATASAVKSAYDNGSDKIPLTGSSEITGSLTVQAQGKAYGIAIQSTNHKVGVHINADDTNRGIYEWTGISNWIIRLNASNRVGIYTAVYEPTSTTTNLIPFYTSGTATADIKDIVVNDGLKYSHRYGIASSSPTTTTDGIGVIQVGNAIVSGTAGNRRGVVRIYSRDKSYIDVIANKTTSVTTLILPANSNNSVIMSEIIMYDNSSGTSTSVTTSSAYTQTFAYFKVFIYNTAQSTTHVVDINGAAGFNQICIGWGMSPSSTSYYKTTNASILTSVSSNKYTFALTLGYTIQASNTGNATATTNPTLYIRKIIGVICQPNNM